MQRAHAFGLRGLQIASYCGKTVNPIFNLKANMINGDQEEIIGRVELPIEISGVIRHMEVSIINRLGADCLLVADFFRLFNAMVHPCENCMTIDGTSELLPLEITTLAIAEAPVLTSIGLADATEQREQLRSLLNELIPEEKGPLQCTTWAEHKIILEQSKPIKQRHYPVSHVIEQEMHAQVRDLLAQGLIRRSDSEYSSPVVMVRKSNGDYRMCIDFRKINAVAKTFAYPLGNIL